MMFDSGTWFVIPTRLPFRRTFVSSGRSGFSVLEVLLAGALFAVFSYGAVEVFLFGLETDRMSEETNIATRYATAGLDAVRAVKAYRFDDLSPKESAGVRAQDGFWELVDDPDEQDGYTRTIRIEAVRRDGDGTITKDGGGVDPDTYRVVVTVSWTAPSTKQNSVELSTYVTRFAS